MNKKTAKIIEKIIKEGWKEKYIWIKNMQNYLKLRWSLSYSIVIPCYNEADNIEECIKRIDLDNRKYEIIVVNDGSEDSTASVILNIMERDKRVKLINYLKNKGKGWATKLGLDAAKNDVLMILDADMTVPPEELSLFIYKFEKENAKFVNGTRMLFPAEKGAMRILHKVGNKIFSMIFSYLLGQKITDTLCGTKCFYRKDYKKFKMKDKAWPDFDLLFSAARLKLGIEEVPVHYQKRIAGESKMKTFKHGMMLLKASFKGFKELKLNRKVYK